MTPIQQLDDIVPTLCTTVDRNPDDADERPHTVQ